MITDRLLRFSNAQTVTATAVSADTADLGVNRDMAPGKALTLSVSVDEAVAAAGAATVTFQIISSAAAALTSPTVLASTDAIGKADLPLGRKPILLALSRNQLIAMPVGQRYLGVQYVVGTGPLTAGKFTANLIDGEQDVNKNYPSGFTVV
jgi:hypothetical protein